MERHDGRGDSEGGTGWRDAKIHDRLQVFPGYRRPASTKINDACNGRIVTTAAGESVGERVHRWGQCRGCGSKSPRDPYLRGNEADLMRSRLPRRAATVEREQDVVPVPATP
jgi:hypothetical protein